MSITAFLLGSLLAGFGMVHTDSEPWVNKTLTVKGNCEMCKRRIERAALLPKGTRYANWDVNSKQLTVEYDSQLLKLQDIEASVAKSGHDTQNVQAPNSSYNALPACCKYKR